MRWCGGSGWVCIGGEDLNVVKLCSAVQCNRGSARGGRRGKDGGLRAGLTCSTVTGTRIPSCHNAVIPNLRASTPVRCVCGVQAVGAAAAVSAAAVACSCHRVAEVVIDLLLVNESVRSAVVMECMMSEWCRKVTQLERSLPPPKSARARPSPSFASHPSLPTH